MHEKDRALLEQIGSFFGVSKVVNRGKDAVQYRVTSIKELAVIIEHFDNTRGTLALPRLSDARCHSRAPLTEDTKL